MKLLQLLSDQVRYKVSGEDFKNNARKKATDFTRKRKMTFEELIYFMLTSLKCSSSSALRRFFIGLGVSVFMTQQSFSEARTKIKVSAFEELFKDTATTMTEHCIQTWHGLRVYAIDGTRIALPTDKKLLKYYGGLGKNRTAPTALGSILYDVPNDIICDAAIEPITTDERTLAKKHIRACEILTPGDKKLIIFDRGYASFEMIELLEEANIKYVMRVKRRFNNDIDNQTKTDAYVCLKQGDKKIHIRVIKFLLDSGEEEVLITNITDKRLGKNAFKKLYFMRWPIEIKYDIVKNKLQLENFNTRTVEGIQQDFFAIMCLANLAASAAIDVQNDIQQAREDKDNKYQYKANMNELIGILKDRFVFAIIQDDPVIQADEFDSILDEIKRYVVPIKPDRSKPRNPTPRDCSFHHNQKVNC